MPDTECACGDENCRHSRDREYKETSNSQVYKKLHKQQHASCTYCPWHGGENTSNKKQSPMKSWKDAGRKQQYR